MVNLYLQHLLNVHLLFVIHYHFVLVISLLVQLRNQMLHYLVHKVLKQVIHHPLYLVGLVKLFRLEQVNKDMKHLRHQFHRKRCLAQAQGQSVLTLAYIQRSRTTAPYYAYIFIKISYCYTASKSEINYCCCR